MLLGVNIDHVATLRQARHSRYPDPISAALLAEQAGADFITLHLREDRRHIQERDVTLLHQIMLTPMNLEMANTEEMLIFAETIKPQFCCLVPENRAELTTEGGLDIACQIDKIAAVCKRLKNSNIRVSLFIDAIDEQIYASKEAGAEAIELHTGHYADAVSSDQLETELSKINNAVVLARFLNMQVTAGHGLNYRNVKKIAHIHGISELNIGHGIISRAIFTGLHEAVREIKNIISRAESSGC